MTMPTIDEAIERAMRAQIYEVVCTAHQDSCCNTYAVMETPKLLIQFGPTYDDGDEATEAAKRLNIRAALSAFLADVPVSEPSEEMLDIGGGVFMIFFKELKERGLNHDEEYDAARCAFSDAWKLMSAKLAEEIQ